MNIRAVVLDKDDCFARPGENEIAPEFKVCDLFLLVNIRWGSIRCTSVFFFVAIFT